MRPKAQLYNADTPLYPTFNDTAEAAVAHVVQPFKTPQQHDKAVIEEKQQQRGIPPLVQVYREEESIKQQQIERDMRVYQERFDHVAKALAGETPHQIEERKKREVERQERQEKRYEAMETRLQHQIERFEEREERRARVQARHHRASRSPSPSRNNEVKTT
ncbi:hypothetical protein PInf_011692 [Phytophthora infestans]|nr:hypothetical protein PInf_011692 [Phytophthora infestans]